MQNYVGLAQPYNRLFCGKATKLYLCCEWVETINKWGNPPPRGSEIVGLGQRFASGLCATVFSKLLPRVWKICNRNTCGLQKAMQNSTKEAHHVCNVNLHTIVAQQRRGVDILPFPLGKKKKFLNLLKKCAQLCLQIFNYVV